MRQHKFRAWDKKTKQMREVIAIVYSDFQIETECYGNLGDPVVDAGVWIRVCLETEHRDFKDVELMEYAEFKDKNRVEVYERDFLKDDYDRILLVEWYQHGFTFRAVTVTNFVRARDISEWFANGETPPEIIGNCFENPELMEVKRGN